MNSADRFYAKVAPMMDDRGCWEWMGSLYPNGYAQFRSVSGGGGSGHRFSYELHYGSIPAGLHIDHLCRNRSCVNPRHLEPVTNAVNSARSGPATKTHCKNGHLLASKNLYRVPRGWRNCKRCRADAELRRYHRKQHQIATGIERILAAELGVVWSTYEAALSALE